MDTRVALVLVAGLLSGPAVCSAAGVQYRRGTQIAAHPHWPTQRMRATIVAVPYGLPFCYRAQGGWLIPFPCPYWYGRGPWIGGGRHFYRCYDRWHSWWYPYWYHVSLGPIEDEPPPLPRLSTEMRELGDSYYGTGDYALALAAYQEALRHSRGNLRARTGSFLALMAQGEHEAAARLVPSLLHRIRGLTRLRNHFEQLDPSAPKLVAQMEDAGRRGPQTKALHVALAALHGAMGSPPRAWDLYLELADGGPPSQEVRKLGSLLRDGWGFGRPMVHMAAYRPPD